MYKLITKKNNLKKLARMAAKLEKAYSDYGYFKEQGIHTESQLPFPMLMSIQEFGRRDGRIPPRKPFAITLWQDGNKILIKTMRQLKKHLMSASGKVSIPINPTLETFGAMGVYYTRKVFGVGTLLDNAPSTIRQKGRNNPLIETGELKKNMAYRTSANKEIKT